MTDEGTGYATPNESIHYSQAYYDSLDRVVQVKNPDGTNVTISFMHWEVNLTDENTNRKQYLLDAYGRIITVREYVSGAVYNTSYGYTAADELNDVTDTQGNILNYSYDTLGRKTWMNDPDLGVWSYNYDRIGNPVNQTDARNTRIAFIYDGLGRVLSKSDGSSDYNYSYDESTVGVLSSLETADYNESYVYDRRLRLVSKVMEIDGINFEINYSYDCLDRVTSNVLPDDYAVNFNYSSQGLLDQIFNSSSLIVAFNYNQFNQPVKRMYPPQVLYTSLGYDPVTSRLTNIVTQKDIIGTSTVHQNLSYTYDPKGNILSIVDGKNSKTEYFSFDDIDRLTYANKTNTYSLNYTYDSIGNILRLSGTEDLVFNYTQESPIHSPTMIENG